MSPNPAKVTNYYTFAINAIGTMLNRCRADWWTGGAGDEWRLNLICIGGITNARRTRGLR